MADTPKAEIQHAFDGPLASEVERWHEREPPAGRIFVPANFNFQARGSDTDIEYLEAAPILAALERVEIIHEGMAWDRTAQIVIRKSDWEVLVNAIRGK